jgi:hypothetical protein
LLENSVVKKFFTTAADGKKYKTNFYNLDAIISVGYPVRKRLERYGIREECRHRTVELSRNT